MIFASNDFNAVLDDILDRSLSLFSLDLGNLRLLRSDGSMQLCACRGYNDPGRQGKPSAALREGGRLDLLRSVASGKGVVLDDIASADGLQSLKAEGARSVVIVPIITTTETLGIIEVASRVPRHFRLDEVRLLEAIGHQIGIAIQKARLVEEAARRARQREARTRSPWRRARPSTSRKRCRSPSTKCCRPQAGKKVTSACRIRSPASSAWRRTAASAEATSSRSRRIFGPAARASASSLPAKRSLSTTPAIRASPRRFDSKAVGRSSGCRSRSAAPRSAS